MRTSANWENHIALELYICDCSKTVRLVWIIWHQQLNRTIWNDFFYKFMSKFVKLLMMLDLHHKTNLQNKI